MVIHYPAPAPGDIVWCRFPDVEGIHSGPKARPALVLSIMDNEIPVRVRVAYGTSQRPTPVRRGELLIATKDKTAFEASGLSYPTKFSLNKVVVVPYTDLWFDLAPVTSGLVAASPKLGSLHATLMVELSRAAREAGLL